MKSIITEEIEFIRKWTPIPTTYLGEKIQIDIKDVPKYRIGWDSKGIKYYQIRAIDEFSRKRLCNIVDEKSVIHTAAFLDNLEDKIGFSIKTVQLFCVQANYPISCIETGSCHKCLCFLDFLCKFTYKM